MLPKLNTLHTSYNLKCKSRITQHQQLQERTHYESTYALHMPITRTWKIQEATKKS